MKRLVYNWYKLTYRQERRNMSDKLKETTSKRIKELRLSHNLTMEVLAEKLGVSKSTIAKWENGYVENLRQDNIMKLASLFNVPPTYIMGYENIENETKNTDSDEQFEKFKNYYSQLNQDQKTIIDNLLASLVKKQ